MKRAVYQNGCPSEGCSKKLFSMIKYKGMIKNSLVIVLIYCGYVLILFVFQRYLLFPGQNLRTLDLPAPKISNLEILWLETSVGNVEAWYMPAKSRSADIKRPAVIFAHGNYELINYSAHELLRYNEMGVDVMLVEFPGYGRSEGYPSEGTITEAFTKAFDWLKRNKEVDGDKIFVYGRSVGGGAACALAKKRNVRAILLQSTFTDLRQFAWRYLAPSFLIRDTFDNLAVVRSFDGPILIFHGEMDNVIPYGNGVTLYKNSRNAKFISYKCHHNDCPPDATRYWESIRKFLLENKIIRGDR